MKVYTVWDTSDSNPCYRPQWEVASYDDADPQSGYEVIETFDYDQKDEAEARVKELNASVS